MRKIIKEIISKTEGEETLSDIFHAKTKNDKIIKTNFHKYPEEWITIHFKGYPRLKNVKLRMSELPKQITEIFTTRRSVRNFSSKRIDFTDLSNILFYSAGLIDSANDLDNSRRPYPSAGARYPLEVYFFAIRVKNLDEGLYHYNVKENLLELLTNDATTQKCKEIIGQDKNLINASCVIVITAALERTRIKYRNRGYRYMLIEAGHLAQNILLLTNYLGLGACAIGGFIDDKINDLLDINNAKEVTLYMIALGTK